MEKRSQPITVQMEPSIVDLIRQTHGNVSLWLHDIAIQTLALDGTLTKEMLEARNVESN